MSTSPLTRAEVGDSITGHDEEAIETHFGFNIYHVVGVHPNKYRRALVFVHLRHQGIPDAEAKKTALDLTIGDAWDYFAESEEVNPEEPDTDAGKGSSQDESELSNSHPSASLPESLHLSTGI